MGEAKERKDELIISALLTAPKVKDASLICKVSATQIYERLKDPLFKQRYNNARREILEESKNRLQNNVGKAVDCMAGIIEDPEASNQVKLNASEAIIRNSIKLTEQVEIITRLNELEERIINNE